MEYSGNSGKCSACGYDFGGKLLDKCPVCGAPNIVDSDGSHIEYIELLSVGPNKVKVIGVIREISGIGLKEAKDFVNEVESNGYGKLILSPGFSFEYAKNALKMEGVILRDEDLDDITNVDENACSEPITMENNTSDIATTEKQTELTQSITMDSSASVDSSGKYVPIFSSKQISQLDRDQTMQVLAEVGRIAKEDEEYSVEMASLTKTKNALLSKADDIRKTVSLSGKRIIWGVTIVAGLLGCLAFPLCIVTALVAYIVMQLTVLKSLESQKQ